MHTINNMEKLQESAKSKVQDEWLRFSSIWNVMFLWKFKEKIFYLKYTRIK